MLTYVIDLSENIDTAADISLAITETIEQHNYVDWQNNTDVHKRIAQNIDYLFYEHEKKGFKVDFDTVDKIIENIKTVAMRRFG